jgi:hypothetical protein
MKLKDFTRKSHIQSTLIRSVIRQIGGFDEFQQRAADVVNYGACGGFNGFFYYSETNLFFKKNKMPIIKMAEDIASDIGEDVISMIGNFNCLRVKSTIVAEALYNPKTEDPENVRNALAWFALEEVCRSFIDVMGE